MSRTCISVIVPTYRRPEWLGEALESIRAQTFVDLECFVVDDGSGDATRGVVENLGRKDERFHYVELPHAGLPGRSRNVGIAQSEGEFIAFLDDDDLWTPDKLARQVALLDAQPGVDVCCGRIEEFGDRRALWPVGDVPREIDLDALAGGNLVATSTVLARAAAIRAASGFDETLPRAQDYDLWLRLSPKHRIVFLDEVVCKYRVHPSNISANRALSLQCIETALRRAHRDGDLTTGQLRKRLRGIQRERFRNATNFGDKLRHLWLRERARFTIRP